MHDSAAGVCALAIVETKQEATRVEIPARIRRFIEFSCLTNSEEGAEIASLLFEFHYLIHLTASFFVSWRASACIQKAIGKKLRIFIFNTDNRG
jgi:hypothetical protein